MKLVLASTRDPADEGKLKGFDVHVNLVLEDAEDIQGGEAAKRYGTMVIRGDSVVFISPAE